VVRFAFGKFPHPETFVGQVNTLLAAVFNVDLPADEAGLFQAIQSSGDCSFVFNSGNSQILLSKTIIFNQIGQKPHVGALGHEVFKLHLFKKEAGQLPANTVGEKDEMLLGGTQLNWLRLQRLTV
jgi:hypothetical protein